MPMVRAMRMLNAIEAGMTTGSELETLLTEDAGRLAELNVLLSFRGQARRTAASGTAMSAVAASSTAISAVIASSTAMAAVDANDQAVRIFMLSGTDQIYSDFVNVTAVAASSTAMTAIAASSTAMTAIAASSTAISAVIASSTAMAAVIASSTAMSAIAASSTAKMAVFNSDMALAAIAASSTALTAMRASASYHLYGGTINTLSGPNPSGSYIVVGLSTSNGTSGAVTISTLRSGSSVSNQQGVYLPRASDGKSYDKAIPVVSPFSVLNSGSGWTWYVGMVRCDI